MKRFLIVIAIVLGATVGCQTPPVRVAKEEAYKRWHHARARMLYGVASEHLKVGQLDRARRTIQEALVLEEDYPGARVLLSKVFIEQGYYGAAIAELEKVREKTPKSPEVFYLLGVAREKQSRLPEALASYRRAYALDDSSLDAVMAAVEVLVKMGQIRQAELYVESYLSAADNEPGMFELAGRLAVMRKDYAAAAEYYQRAQELKPRNLRYREALGRAQVLGAQYAEGLETLKGLTERKDYKVPTWAYTMLGDCYMALDQPLRARDTYQIAGDREPSVPGTWVNLAKALLALGDAPRAILSARQALRIDGRFLDAALVLGYSLLKDGQVAQAVSVLAEAAAVHPDSSMLRCLLGRAHAASGNEVEAIRCYTAALRLKPENRMARELLGATNAKAISGPISPTARLEN